MHLLSELLTVEHMLWMGLDLTLGVCLKLMCDNGRIHWRDFVNDTMFWVPGIQQLAGDGLTREVEAAIPAPQARPVEETALPLAAK